MLNKIDRQKIDGRGVANHLIIDFAGFGFPLFYNHDSPTMRGTQRKCAEQQFNDAFAPNEMGLAQPRTQSRGFMENFTWKHEKSQNINK